MFHYCHQSSNLLQLTSLSDWTKFLVSPSLSRSAFLLLVGWGRRAGYSWPRPCTWPVWWPPAWCSSAGSRRWVRGSASGWGRGSSSQGSPARVCRSPRPCSPRQPVSPPHRRSRPSSAGGTSPPSPSPGRRSAYSRCCGCESSAGPASSPGTWSKSAISLRGQQWLLGHVQTHLCDVVVGLRLPAKHLVQLQHQTGLAVVHPELLRLAALDICVVSHPLYRSHCAPQQSQILFDQILSKLLRPHLSFLPILVSQLQLMKLPGRFPNE